MTKSKEKKDKHFPLFAHLTVSRLFEPPKNFFNHYVSEGHIVADLGCGSGYYTFSLAKKIGSKGKVFAVDLDEKCIRYIDKKVKKRGYTNIEAHASSANDLNFIKKNSIDFILANGLLCSMAPQHHEATIKEMKRILKPGGLAYISAAKGKMSYVDDKKWKEILNEFKIKYCEDKKSNRWAEVTLE